jgi:hypothetical protein
MLSGPVGFSLSFFFSASRGILQVFFPTGYVIIINVVTSAL